MSKNYLVNKNRAKKNKNRGSSVKEKRFRYLLKQNNGTKRLTFYYFCATIFVDFD